MIASTLLALTFAVGAAAGTEDDAVSDDNDFVDIDGDGIDDELLAPSMPGDDDDDEAVGETLIGRRRDQRRMVGSAHVIDQETLERFEADDVHRVLRSVPGVYVRDEDGVGLRPNIGLRGASSDRSAKVTLLEDGVLFTPAPYAAPAAYYFPLTTRMTGVEVWKGPAAIRQGPHTIGGAINLRTRPVSLTTSGGLDLGFGLVGPGREQTRFHGFFGDSVELGGPLQGFMAGFLVEAARVESDGFKVIDGHEDVSTGFVRDDVMVKARVASALLAEVRHSLELKLGLGREESNESYLGLSDADFRADPDRRYAASLNDHMRWTRTQAQLRYGLQAGPIDLDVVAYRHDLDRSWNKVNGVRGAPNLHDVLGFADVGTNSLFASRLNSAAEGPDDGAAVLIGPNNRTYYSEGVAVVSRIDLDIPLVAGINDDDPGLVLGQRLELGLRVHRDRITRDHREEGFFVVDNQLVRDGLGEVQTADNEANAQALAVYVADELRLGRFTLVPGVRVEVIGGTFIDRRGDVQKDSQQLAFLPGVGGGVRIFDGVDVIAGVHRGFSPVAPGQSGEVRPEESTNGELGVRFDAARSLGLSGEVIGYLSQYDNIVGECTFSAGCVDDLGIQQNGGAALVGGAEIALRHRLPLRLLRKRDALQLEATATFTQARFLTDFVSTHPLFGRVTAGDEMAYVPAMQAALVASLMAGPVDVGVSLGMISAMRDTPGQDAFSAETAREWTDPQAIIDVVVATELSPGWRINTKLDNILDQRAIVSRRPFGARPSKPRTILVSLEADFGQ
jgi:Fe(3+) dicitrate transport protein